MGLSRIEWESGCGTTKSISFPSPYSIGFYNVKSWVRRSLGCGEKWMAGGAKLTFPVIQFVIIRKARASTIPLFTPLYNHLQWHLRRFLIPILRVEKRTETIYLPVKFFVNQVDLKLTEFSQMMEKFWSLWIIQPTRIAKKKGPITSDDFRIEEMILKCLFTIRRRIIIINMEAPLYQDF